MSISLENTVITPPPLAAKAQRLAGTLKTFEELRSRANGAAKDAIGVLEPYYRSRYAKYSSPRVVLSSRKDVDGQPYRGKNIEGISPFAYPSYRSSRFDNVEDLDEFLKGKIQKHTEMLQHIDKLLVEMSGDRDQLLPLRDYHAKALAKWNERLNEPNAKKESYFMNRPKNAIDTMGFSWAHEKGLTGKGVKVFAYSEGAPNLTLPKLRHHMPFRPQRKPLRNPSSKLNQPEKFEAHATQVAAIVAAKNIGVAPEVSFSPLLKKDTMQVHSVYNSGCIINYSGISLSPIAMYLLEDDDSLAKMSDSLLIKIIKKQWPDDVLAIHKILRKPFYSKELKKEMLSKFLTKTQKVISTRMKTLTKGNLLVQAAGNDGVIISQNTRQRLVFSHLFQDPSLLNNTILVVNVERDGMSPAQNSNLPGEELGESTLCAYGTDIDTSAVGGSKATSGTSFAAPYVAGAAALLKEAFPALSTIEIRSCLLEGATPIILGKDGRPELLQNPNDLSKIEPDTIKKSRAIFGRGLLNVKGAYLLAEQRVKQLSAVKAEIASTNLKSDLS